MQNSAKKHKAQRNNKYCSGSDFKKILITLEKVPFNKKQKDFIESFIKPEANINENQI